ncbi:MAG TPA: DUF2399 domain-containing protein [Nitrososphaera sp.]|jgi:hypothetical protein
MSANHRDRWTQDSVWYNFQPVLQKYGISVTREHVKKLIRVVCAKLGVTRESLGIFAGARATMYFDGGWSSVSFDAIQELAGNGTDVIIIEKMALVHVLAPYADKYGVALVNTTGYFTEYGKKLMRAAHNAGGHVVIITDYDMVGLHIASKVPGIPRLGIDEETLDYFGLAKEAPLILSYAPRLKERKFLSYYSDVIDTVFIEHSRVEIDGVLAAVGSERLWEYIMYKLKKMFPIRDYNRVIQEQPASSSPGAIGDIEDYIEYVKEKVTHAKWGEIQKSLAEVEGMIDIIVKRKEIEGELQELVTNDERMKVIVSKFKELKTELQVDSDKDFAKYRKEASHVPQDSDGDNAGGDYDDNDNDNRDSNFDDKDEAD